ncbi:MAG: response regulator [Chloroflexota bacterium]|nr:response regulator [Chloroflexota bacterium]
MSLIIIIEDNLPNARLADKVLSRAGHQVVLAQDGEAGLMKVMEMHPDLVLVDLGLPDMDGQTVVALLRQQTELDHIPILAFTAWPEHAAQEMARAYGCDGVIIKPIDTRTFADEVGAYLSTKAVP